MNRSQLEQSVSEVRGFNRFYTKQIGLLNRGLLKTEFSLVQARILFELAQQETSISTNLVKELDIDPSYLSRILSSFEKKGLIVKEKSEIDNRQRLLRLTKKGKLAYRELNKRASKEIREILVELSSEDRYRFLSATKSIQDIFELDKSTTSPYLLRSYGPGDIGWIIHRHGTIYAEEYNWDESFEALVADILVNFIHSHDEKRENIWIAEQDGQIIGCVVLVDAGNDVSQLRLLLVEPKARGKGVGRRLIQECIDFSKRNGYKTIKLWTNKNLTAARHLYKMAGFKCVSEKPHKSFGHNLVEEFWELDLKS